MINENYIDFAGLHRHDGFRIVCSDLILAETVVVNLDLASTMDQPDAYDNVRSSRAFQFSGTVNVRLDDAFSLTNGSFDLLRGSGSAGGVSGEPVVNLPDPPAGSNWRLEQTDTRLILHLDVINDTEEFQEQAVHPHLFPNPIPQGGELTVNLPGKEAIGQLFTATGQLLKTQDLRTGQNRFQTMDIPAGQYWLFVGDARLPVIIQ